MSNTPTPAPGTYRHYKGGFYLVYCIATDADTGEQYVVYRGLDNGRAWIRKLGSWLEPVDGQPRYAPVDKAVAKTLIHRKEAP